MTSRIDIYDRSRGGPHGGGPHGGFERDRRVPPRRKIALALLAERLGGERVRDGSSSVFKVEQWLPGSSSHGSVGFGNLERLDSRLLGVLFPSAGVVGSRQARGTPRPPPGPTAASSAQLSAAGTGFSDLVFFDIETTGLSGGAGTLVFLAGIVRIQKGEIRLTQYLLENLASERLFLSLLKEELGAGRALVSYNGRCFDTPIIRNRLIMNGFRPSEPEPPHFDLLYPARRIWRGRLPDFSLQTVERGILRVERGEDVPGYRIPEIYFQYLRGEDVAQDLHGVFIHNRSDSLSLLALLVKQLSLIEALVGEDQAKPGNSSGHDLVSKHNHVSWNEPAYNPGTLSDMLVSGNLGAHARKLLERHSEDSEALRRLGILLKREKLFSDAREAFMGLLGHARGLMEYVFACTELAKLYEHSLRDLEAARKFAERAVHRIERAELFNSGACASIEREKRELRRRLLRLERKLRLKKGCL